MKARNLAFAALIGCPLVWAGEIIIGAPGAQQPTAHNPPKEREPTRSEREAGRSAGKARQYAGTGGPAVVEESTSPRPLDKTEKSMSQAQDYLRPGADAAGTEGAAVILRAAPPGDAERARLKARSYVATESSKPARNCSEVATTVGSIGEGAGATKSVNVVEKGNSTVNVNCR